MNSEQEVAQQKNALWRRTGLKDYRYNKQMHVCIADTPIVYDSFMTVILHLCYQLQWNRLLLSIY